MVILDFIWLGIMLNRFYIPKLGHLLGQTVHFTPAIAFYLIYATALTVLIVSPAVQSESSSSLTFFRGMIFGLAAYGTYDLTNQAILKDWPSIVTIIDIAWGSLLTGVVSWITVYLSVKYT